MTEQMFHEHTDETMFNALMNSSLETAWGIRQEGEIIPLWWVIDKDGRAQPAMSFADKPETAVAVAKIVSDAQARMVVHVSDAWIHDFRDDSDKEAICVMGRMRGRDLVTRTRIYEPDARGFKIIEDRRDDESDWRSGNFAPVWELLD
jgi:hypothetical protein